MIRNLRWIGVSVCGSRRCAHLFLKVTHYFFSFLALPLDYRRFVFGLFDIFPRYLNARKRIYKQKKTIWRGGERRDKRGGKGRGTQHHINDSAKR